MAATETPLKVGLIGLGAVAEAHLAGAVRAAGAQVIAGADLEPARRTAAADRWNLRCYADVGEMLEREDLDGVCVLTPARTHLEIVRQVAAAGIHILCEKPLAASVADARDIVAECSRHGVKLFYGSTYRFLPAVRRAKGIVDNGEIGEVRLVTESFVGGAGADSWRDLGPGHYPPGEPGGGGKGLVDHGIHVVDVFRWLTASEVVEVVGRGNVSGAAPQPELLVMIFKSGAVGQLLYDEATFPSDLPWEGQFSWGGRWAADGGVLPGGVWDDHPMSIRVHGTKGSLRVFPYGSHLFQFKAGNMHQVPLEGAPMPGNFTLQLESFARSVRDDTAPEISGEDGVRALEIVHAAYRTWAERRFAGLDSSCDEGRDDGQPRRI
jgi:predicted dehydrogenase